MRPGAPELSAWCSRSGHDRCPHWAAAMRIEGRRRLRPAPVMLLCSCPCHSACPLTSEDTAARNVWNDRCVCPGASTARASLPRSARRRAEVARIVTGADLTDHPDAEEIESRLRAVLEEHGDTPPHGLPLWSRIAGGGSSQPSAYRAVGGVAIAGTLLTAAAVASTGWRRLLWGAAAAGAWLLSGYAVSVVTAVAEVSRAAEARHARGEDLPRR